MRLELFYFDGISQSGEMKDPFVPYFNKMFVLVESFLQLQRNTTSNRDEPINRVEHPATVDEKIQFSCQFHCSRG